MNSLVLKPCRCVVFFAFIPTVAPSGSGLCRGAGLATLTRARVICRVDGDGLRLAREGDFLAFRLAPAALFLVRRRVFSATALAWISTPLLTVPRKRPGKISSRRPGA